jgi:hypothetical protein
LVAGEKSVVGEGEAAGAKGASGAKLASGDNSANGGGRVFGPALRVRTDSSSRVPLNFESRRPPARND